MGEGGLGQRRPGIAVVVFMAGEEAGIDAAFESVSWADEVLAVDLGAAEATRRACEAHGAAAITADDLAGALVPRRVKWTLLMEGYEEVSPALAREICATVGAEHDGTAPVAYRIPRRVRFLGRTLRSRAWAGPGGIRLARPETISWPDGLIAGDALRARGPVGHLVSPLLAKPSPHLRDHVRRMDMLTTAAARAQHRAGLRAHWMHLAVRPLLHGLRVLPGAALRDGVPGIILAVLEAYASVLTCAKRWELEHMRRVS